ncbi:MAG: lycopene cyclase domain-containing protein, partial [Bacteroidetes bacterium]|nr:lycopene cyclase domain-containing protein [Bacteroidota bacterium]
MQLYLWINIFMVMLAMALVFALKLPLFKNYFALIPALIIPAVFFIVIEGFFTRWSLCGLHGQYLLGFYWLGLPIEQMAFYFSMPLLSLATYEAVDKLLHKDVLRLFTKAITVFLLLLTIILFFV